MHSCNQATNHWENHSNLPRLRKLNELPTSVFSTEYMQTLVIAVVTWYDVLEAQFSTVFLPRSPEVTTLSLQTQQLTKACFIVGTDSFFFKFWDPLQHDHSTYTRQIFTEPKSLVI